MSIYVRIEVKFQKYSASATNEKRDRNLLLNVSSTFDLYFILNLLLNCRKK